MTRRAPAIHVAVLLTFLLPAACRALAQSPTALPKLDTDKFMTGWNTIARYPIHRQRACLGDELVLYALGDKKNTFQVVTSCRIKDDNFDTWNRNGKLNPAGNGQLRLRWIWPFTTAYWVLAVAPDNSWALVGTPSRKSLWVLSKTPTLAPDALSQIESQAAAEGFDTSRLIRIAQPDQNAPQIKPSGTGSSL